MGDIQSRYSKAPYGWRDIDIAATVCTLVALHKITLKYCGSTLQPTDKHIPDYLRKRTEIDKTIVSRRVIVDDRLMKMAREMLKEYFNTMDLPADEDGVIAYVLEHFTEQRDTLQKMLTTDYASGRYPDKAIVEEGIRLCTDLLSQKKDNVALLTKLIELTENFLNFAEDMVDVYAFFKNQKQVFDSAATLYDAMNAEREYLQVDDAAMQSLAEIQRILQASKPYKQISNLPNLMHTVQQAYQNLMNLKRLEVVAELDAALAEIRQTATADQQDVVERANRAFADKSDAANAAKSLTSLDAMKIQITALHRQYLQLLMPPIEPGVDAVSVNRAGLCHAAKLESEADIDTYLAEIKARLMSTLGNHDVLHII